MSTTACSLVSFRSGAGMRTFAGIRILRKLIVDLTELRDGRFNHKGFLYLVEDHFLGFVAVPRDVGDRRLVGSYSTRSHHLLQSSDRHAPGRLRIDAFRLSERENAFNH